MPSFPRISATLIFFVFVLFVSKAENIGEKESLNINVRNIPLSEVFNSITEQTGIRFSYNPQLIDTKKNVSVEIRDKSLEETLSELLPSSVSVKRKGKYLILSSPKEEQSSISTIFSNTPAEVNIEKNEEDTPLIFNESSNNFKKISIPDTGIVLTGCHNNVNLKNEEEMKLHLAALAVLTATMTTQVSAQENEQVQAENHGQEYTETEKGQSKPFQFSFIYPLGTDFVNSNENTYDISFNLIGGVTGRVNGFELATVFNMNKYSATGLQLAGAFNLAGYDFVSEDESNVVQLASAFNFVSSGTATQLAGGLNFTEKGALQAAAGANIGKEVNVQMSGGLNVAQKANFQAAAGLNVVQKANCQLAGGVNIAQKSNFQAAAGMNIAKETNCQLVGGMNIAGKSSCQIGVLNITGKGGFQLGVVNVRDTADGVPIGLINIVKRGGLSDFGIETGDFIHTALTFRSGTYRFYTIFSGGWNFTNDMWSTGFGLGTGFRFTNWLGLNLELMYHNVFEVPHYDNSYNGLVQIRPMLDFRLARRFKIFAGPTANLLIQTRLDDNNYLKSPYKSLYNRQINDTMLDAWIGFTAGIRF